MLGKLSVALLIIAAPAAAAEKASAEIFVDKTGQAYKIKKVCQTVEVSGSFIPRTSCVNKKIPVKRPEAETQEAAASTAGTTAPGAEAPEE